MKEIDKIKKLLDSGERTSYKNGGMREICQDKGRCDLIFNTAFSVLLEDKIFYYIEEYVREGLETYIFAAIKEFISKAYDNDYYTAYLELAKHYQAGAEKYEERNFEKGLPFHTYVDSGLRHYVKWCRGDKDEPHDRAFLWNMISLLYSIRYKPEFNDLPHNKKEN
jgi:hypothetical protein